MTLGTKCLVRPIHNVARLTSHSKSYAGGTKLAGHIYSTKLDTPYVCRMLPLDPKTAPFRTVVISPFAKETTVLTQAKIAATKKDSIVSPQHIKSTLDFFKMVDNPVMANIGFDQSIFDSLPNNEVSPHMFTDALMEEEEGEEKDLNSDERDEDTDSYSQPEKTDGGPSLLRSESESENVVATSATITIGHETPTSDNAHEKVVKVLKGKASSSMETYVVRPESTFVNDADPLYLENHFPDLFPFGRGGFGEPRKIRISRKAFLGHSLRLSSRQFQTVDYLLPMYDMITRQLVSTMGFVRSRLPSRLTPTNGSTITNAEAFAGVSTADMEKVKEYKVQCSLRASKGQPLPEPPTSVDGVAMDFFTNVEVISQSNQHSQAAATKYRNEVYAAHNSEGKAQIWFTFCPDDTNTFKIMWYALGPDESEPHEDAIPTGILRFDVLATHPVAAALHFEDVLALAIKYMCG